MVKGIKKIILFSIFCALCFTISSCGKTEKRVKIGFLQPFSITSMELMKQKFVEQLNELGFIKDEHFITLERNYNYDVKVANTYASEIVDECDLVVAIGSIASMILFNVISEKGSSVPLVYCSVTDPINAGLYTSDGKPRGNLTGTCDLNPVDKQIDLVREIFPDIDTLGFLYNVEEINSLVQVDMAQRHASTINLAIRKFPIKTADEIEYSINYLAKEEKIKAMFIPIDTFIGDKMDTIKKYAEPNKILVVCADIGMVDEGGSIAYAMDYAYVGRLTGEIAYQILVEKKDPKSIPITYYGDHDLILHANHENLETIGVTLPQSILDRLAN